MDPNILKQLNIERRENRSHVHVTDLADGRDRLVGADAAVHIPGQLGEAICVALDSGNSTICNIDGREFFLNVYNAQF